MPSRNEQVPSRLKRDGTRILGLFAASEDVQALKEDQVVDPAGDVKVRGAKESEGPRRPERRNGRRLARRQNIKRLTTGLALNAISSQRTVPLRHAPRPRRKT